jgi:hypothetical protein
MRPGRPSSYPADPTAAPPPGEIQVPTPVLAGDLLLPRLACHNSGVRIAFLTRSFLRTGLAGRLHARSAEGAEMQGPLVRGSAWYVASVRKSNTGRAV